MLSREESQSLDKTFTQKDLSLADAKLRSFLCSIALIVFAAYSCAAK
jgi:hypothetical protein